MSEREKSGDMINANLSGNISGQVSVGKGIAQAVGMTRLAANKVDLAELR